MVTLVLRGHHRDMVTLFPTGSDLILVTLFLTLAFSGECGCHLHLTWTWSFWSAPEITLDLVTVVPTWASPRFGDSGPHLGTPGSVDHDPQLGKFGTR